MSDSRETSMKRVFMIATNIIACTVVCYTAVWGMFIIKQTEPAAQEINTKRTSAALVETVTVKRGEYQPDIVVLGTIKPAQSIVLGSRVAGQVVEISPNFVPGGMIRKGEMLLRIDASDFENTLKIRKNELKQSEASLEIEQARRGLATRELDLLGKSIAETDRALVLRKPQLDSIISQVDAAKAAVNQAELDLNRTKVQAPFDAQIIRRAVNEGSQVTPGNDLGQLVGIREYWVIASVPLQMIPWIRFADETQAGSSVELSDTNNQIRRKARVLRMIGALDQQTRLVRVLITVPDPLGLEAGTPPLILDSLMEVTIHGRPIENVIRLNRKFVRDGNTVWVMKNGTLQIRQTEIVFRDSQHAYISKGMEDGERVVTTNLSIVAEGISLREVNGSQSEEDENDREAKK